MNFDDIIKKYGNELGIIANVDELINELKNSYPKDDLINLLKYIINYNNNIYNIIRRKIDSNININHSIILNDNLKTIIGNNDHYLIDNSKINIDITKYINLILKSNNKQDIINVLPTSNNKNFDNILLSIKCKILEYIFLFKKELMNNNLNLNDKIYCQNQIDLLQFKLDIIENHHINNKQNYTITNEKNKLIFLNNNEKVTFFNDLKDINFHNYHIIFSLLNCIIDNTFANQKYFNNNEILKEIFEVRDIKMGPNVLFNRIYKNYYVIIFASSKCGLQTSIYQEQLKNRINLFYNSKENIKRLLIENNLEFLNYQNELQRNILEILQEKNNSFQKKKDML